MLIFGSMPIGDPQDISLKMIKLIECSDLIIVETVFKFLKLSKELNLKYSGRVIEWNTIYVHDQRFEYVKNQNISIIKDYLSKGFNVLFISDEGQSCLNDPGYDLLSLTNDIKYDIDIIAGPSVITTAASYAAINNLGFSNFIFLVNIEQNKEKRIEYLNKIKGLSSNIIFTTVYPTYFNQSVLEDILNILGDKKIVLCMSLTMENQKIITLRINELIEKLNNDDSFMLDQNKFYSPVTIAILN